MEDNPAQEEHSGLGPCLWKAKQAGGIGRWPGEAAAAANRSYSPLSFHLSSSPHFSSPSTFSTLFPGLPLGASPPFRLPPPLFPPKPFYFFLPFFSSSSLHFRLPLTFFPLYRRVPSGLFFSFYFPTPATLFPASSSSLSPPLSHVSVVISFCSLFFFPSLHLFLSTLCVFHRGSAASPGRSRSNTRSFQPAASPCSTATMLSVIWWWPQFTPPVCVRAEAGGG